MHSVILKLTGVMFQLLHVPLKEEGECGVVVDVLQLSDEGKPFVAYIDRFSDNKPPGVSLIVVRVPECRC